MDWIPWAVLTTAACALGIYGLGVIAVLRHTRRPAFSVDGAELPPVSILKPLKGDEEGLAENLRSFFVQDYPSFQIVFSTTEPDDPAIAVARSVAAQFPDVDVRFAHSDAAFGLNPKVSNLRGAMRAASYDLVLQSDANVRARPDYLRRVVSELLSEKGSLLSSLVVGVGERSIGAAMENLQLSAMIAPSVCFALHFFSVTCVIGKSMLFRRSELAEMGGLERVKDLLAEDFMLGRFFEEAGRRVLLSTTVAENVNHETTVDRFMSRHARWLKMRTMIHVPAFILDLFANPVALSVLAIALSLGDLRIVSLAVPIVLGKVALDAWVLQRVRGTRMALRHLAVAPLKDILLFALWPYCAVSRSIEWRGARLRLGWNTVLRPDHGALPVRVARRIFGASA